MKSMKSVSFLLLALAGALLAIDLGTDSPNTEGLYHVLVTTKYDNFGHCGGALVSPKWVLTAAYCRRDDLEVILGHHPRLRGTRMKVIDNFSHISKNKKHNIMMLKINSNSFPSATLPPIQHCLSPTDVVKFYGWINPVYDFTNDRDVAQNLKTGELTVSSCINIPEREKQPVSVCLQHQDNHLLCTEHPSGVNDCELYAGTSLMHGDILHGVLVNYDILCQKQMEFIDVCAYRQWIEDVINGVAKKGVIIQYQKSNCGCP